MDIRDDKMDMIEDWGERFISSKDDNMPGYVNRYMKSHDSWNEPIIVLDVLNSNISEGQMYLCDIEGDYFLLEGHSRLSCQMAKIKHDENLNRSEHDVWLVTID